MSAVSVSFADNLYASAGIPGGCGLKGWSHGSATFFYERHDIACAPGKWRVGITSSSVGEFWRLLNHSAVAVVDDFGDLQMVDVR